MTKLDFNLTERNRYCRHTNKRSLLTKVDNRVPLWSSGLSSLAIHRDMTVAGSSLDGVHFFLQKFIFIYAFSLRLT